MNETAVDLCLVCKEGEKFEYYVSLLGWDLELFLYLIVLIYEDFDVC